MKTADIWRAGKHALLVLAVVAMGLVLNSCRTDEVEVPPLTGPSGARLFITIEAAPDHLVIHQPGRPRETSRITVQLKNHLGVGVPGENIKLRITNIDFSEINIGRLSDYNVTTDSAGFGRVVYTAPDSAEQLAATRIYVLAILTNPAYVDEVTDIHQLDLEMSAVPPGTCTSSPRGPVPGFTINPNPGSINEQICFDASETTGGHALAGFSWTFGDGSRANGQLVCHTYTSAGTFTVSLLVQDVQHNCASIAQTVTIDNGDPPTCAITVTPTPVIVDEEVNFIAIATDTDGAVTKFRWNFGDGTTGSSGRNTITHRYRSVGTFAVVLTVFDDQGNTGTCQTTVSVTIPTCPTISILPTALSAGAVGVAYPTTTLSQTGGVSPVTFSFSGALPPGLSFTPFVGGATISGTPTIDGTFQFAVTATDADGCTGTVNYTVVVVPPPVP